MNKSENGEIAWNCILMASSPIHSVEISVFKHLCFQINQDFNPSDTKGGGGSRADSPKGFS